MEILELTKWKLNEWDQGQNRGDKGKNLWTWWWTWEITQFEQQIENKGRERIEPQGLGEL